MTTPIGLQLYTVHNEAERDFVGVLERAAEIGFRGVETAGLHGMPANELKVRLNDLGLELTSAYLLARPPFGDDAHKLLDEQEVLDNNVVITDFGQDSFTSLDAIKRAAELFNEAAAMVRDRGMVLGYHNHWWEFTASKAGPNPMAEFVDRLDPDIFVLLDVYWLLTSGIDPLPTIEQLGSRIRHLHVKDGPCTVGAPMTAVGAGKVDIPTVLAAVPQAKWHHVEIDEYDGDMFEAVEASYQYLTENGLSQGRERGV